MSDRLPWERPHDGTTAPTTLTCWNCGRSYEADRPTCPSCHVRPREPGEGDLRIDGVDRRSSEPADGLDATEGRPSSGTKSSAPVLEPASDADRPLFGDTPLASQPLFPPVAPVRRDVRSVADQPSASARPQRLVDTGINAHPAPATIPPPGAAPPPLPGVAAPALPTPGSAATGSGRSSAPPPIGASPAASATGSTGVSGWGAGTAGPVPSAPSTVAIVGVVNGTVSIDAEVRRLWGKKACLLAGLVLLTVALVRNENGLSSAVDLMSKIFIGLIIIGTVVTAVTRGGPSFDSLLYGGVSWAATTTARTASRGVRAVGRKGAAGGRASGSEHIISVRRFRVQEITGPITACVLRGELDGDEVRHGDIVRVVGRRAKQGHVEARRIEVLSSPTGPLISAVTARLPPGLRVAMVVDACAKVTAAIIVVNTLLYFA